MDSSKFEIAQEIQQKNYADAQVVFLAGSYVRGEHTKYSDLDLVVIYASIPQAFRKSYTYRSTPVEAFVHDAETLEYFFESVDRPSGVPSLMQMVVEGIELPEKSELSGSLKALAQQYIDMGPPALSKEENERRRYAITDMLDDIRDPRSYNELVATGSKLLGVLADYYCRVNGLWSAKGKSVPRVLKKHDMAYHDSFTQSFECLFRNGDPGEVIVLAEKMLEPHGGLLFDGYSLPAPEQWRRVKP